MTIIAPAKNIDKLIYENGKTVDIQQVILSVNKDGIWKQTKKLSEKFEPTRSGLRNLWSWVKTNIKYVEDPNGVQYVRDPARLYKDRQGDCKSFTLFIVSVLQNMGLTYTIRFTSYKNGPVTHVYPIAYLSNGEAVILDAVWYAFDSEKGYKRKEDFKFQKKMTKIYRLSGIGNAEGNAAKFAERWEQLTNDINDRVLTNDITQMSESEFYQYLGYKKVSGIGAAFDHRPAFAAPVVTFNASTINAIAENIGLFKKKAAKTNTPAATPAAQQGKGKGKQILKKAGQKVQQAAKKVGAKLKEAWTKVVNWVFKAALPAAAPFFLFTFITRKVSSKIDGLKAKQNRILDWIAKIGNIDRSKIDAALRVSILKKFGKQPEAVLNAAAKSQVSSIGFDPATIGVAIKALMEIIKKIKALFPKKQADPEAPAPSTADGSDLSVLATEAEKTGNTQPAPSNPQGKVIVKPSPAPSDSDEGGEANPSEPESEPPSDNTPAPNRNKDKTPAGNHKKNDNTMLYGIAAVAVAVYVLTN